MLRLHMSMPLRVSVPVISGVLQAFGIGRAFAKTACLGAALHGCFVQFALRNHVPHFEQFSELRASDFAGHTHPSILLGNVDRPYGVTFLVHHTAGAQIIQIVPKD